MSKDKVSLIRLDPGMYIDVPIPFLLLIRIWFLLPQPYISSALMLGSYFDDSMIRISSSIGLLCLSTKVLSQRCVSSSLCSCDLARPLSRAKDCSILLGIRLRLNNSCSSTLEIAVQLLRFSQHPLQPWLSPLHLKTHHYTIWKIPQTCEKEHVRLKKV